MTAISLTSAIERVSVECQLLAQWWLQEFRDAWRALLAIAAPNGMRPLVLDLDCGPPVVCRTAEGAPIESPGLNFDGGERAPELRKLRGVTARPLSVRLVLPLQQALLCELRIPPMPERHVAAAVELQIEREMPLPREQLYFDWAVTPRNADTSRRVTVAMARRSVVDQWLADLVAAGFRVLSITCKGPNGARPFDLLPKSANRVSLAYDRWDGALAVTAAALATLWVALIAGQWIYERVSLRDELAEARSDLDAIASRRAQIDDIGKPLAQLAGLVSKPTAGEVLLTVGAAVPPDTWIYQADIQLREDENPLLSLEGYTPDVTALVETMQRAAQLESVQLVAAAEAPMDANLQRVQLNARFKQGGAE